MIKWFGLFIGGVIGNGINAIALVVCALLGYLFGVWLERHSNPLMQHRRRLNQDKEAFKHLLHQSTFLMMGYLAKVDGVVSKREIAMAESIFDSFGLSVLGRQDAIRLFTAGKHRSFQLDTILEPLSSVARKHRGLIRVFLEIQARIIIADGNLNSVSRKLFYTIAKHLGFSDQAAGNILRQVRVRAVSPASIHIKEAYALLDVSEGCSNKTLKTAYRRAMSEHHPDKLQSDGATDQMIQAATEQTQTIQNAYQIIQTRRTR
jgi:DnaJ like chaperone protein